MLTDSVSQHLLLTRFDYMIDDYIDHKKFDHTYT